MINDTIIRISRPDDVNKLRDLDMKCYPYPQDMDFWRAVSQDENTTIIILEVVHQAAGFAVWSYGGKEATIHKLGVHPKYRRKGLGRLLVAACYRHVKDRGCDTISLVIPHIHCCPGDEDDVSVFLNKTGFTATGKVLTDFRIMYGSKVDGYIFARKINDPS